MVAQGIKVICLDMTNQYESELRQYYNEEIQISEKNSLETIGAQGKNNSNLNVEEGGSILQFRNELKNQLSNFIDGNNASDF